MVRKAQKPVAIFTREEKGYGAAGDWVCYWDTACGEEAWGFKTEEDALQHGLDNPLGKYGESLK